jgi:signal transduction histidine kinase
MRWWRTGLPFHIYGLFAVSAASLLLIIGSFLHVWQLPVTPVSGIAPYSDILLVRNGKVTRSPSGHYAFVDLQPGDYILEYDGMTWEQAHRLNIHVLSEKQAGDVVRIWIKRGNDILKRTLPVVQPDLWERLILIIPVVSALICWLPTTFLLGKLSQELLARDSPQPLLAYQSGIPLWFLAWQSVSIAQSLSSLKYPVALLFMEALIPVAAVLIAISSSPYPLAPRSLRHRWLLVPLFILALLTSLIILWYGVQSPFPSSDWRRSTQILRSSDTLAIWARMVTLVGVMIAALSILATTSFTSLVEALEGLARLSSRQVRYLLLKLAQQIETIYSRCPTSLKVIARFQLMIALVYLVFDLFPRLIGEGSGGYSVLFAAIPLSYLLLWSDLSGQEQVWRGMNIMLGFVLLIQVPNLVYRFLTSDEGTNLGDTLTILFVGGGTILGGLALALDQWQRQRASSDELPQAIDELFSLQTQTAFWDHLVQQVSKHVGVRNWIWIVQDAQFAPALRRTVAANDRDERGQELRAADGHACQVVFGNGWRVIACTPQAQPDWLDSESVQEVLSPPPSQPDSVVVNGYDLPMTLIFLPIYRDQQRQEILIAVNPQWVQHGVRLLDPAIAGRLKDAVTTLRFVEQQQELARQQHRLAEERLLRAEAYRQLERKQADEARSVSLIAFALLHNDVLQRIPFLADQLRRMAKKSDDEGQREKIGDMVQEMVRIDVKIREILQDLRVRIARERLIDTLQDMVRRHQQQYPAINFVTIIEPEDLPLNEAQRDLVFLVVREALENAVEHASPATIQLAVWQQARRLVVEVSDDGCGFAYDPAQASTNALGLLLMSDLSEALGGFFTVDTRPGGGCRVQLEVEIAKNDVQLEREG